MNKKPKLSVKARPSAAGTLGNRPMEIILARHGKPNLPMGVWITPWQMKEWIQRYNQADVVLENIPDDIKAIAETATIVVSSPHRRCVQSLRQVSPSRAPLTEVIFCEADLPHPSWRFPKLPLAVFGVVFRLAWFYGFSANAESLAQANVRARLAAERLVELAKENNSVFLMGHGVMTILIAKHLLELGWTGPKRPINKFWQFSVYHA